MASIPQKDERQYAGTQYQTSDPTPSDELIDKVSDKDNFSPKDLGRQSVKYYANKLRCLDLSLEFSKLTSGSSPTDILKVASVILSYVISKIHNSVIKQ